MRLRAISIVFGYVLLLVVCLYVYHHYPDYRRQIEFWIPQLFLLSMIAVTSLYVFFTARLVEETRRLQDRPMIQLTFREVPEEPALKMDKLFEPANEILRGLVARIVGGQEMQVQPRFLVIELKNIGRSTVRNLSATVALTFPTCTYNQEQQFDNEIEQDKKLLIAIAPASVPLVSIEVLNMTYGDGLQKYSNFYGSPLFRGTMGV
jgi:hypothetical protein